jgi:flagellar FliL protein
MSANTPEAGQNQAAVAEPVPASPRTKPVVLFGVLALAAVAGVGGGFVLAPRLVKSPAAAGADAAAEDEGEHEAGAKGEKGAPGRIFKLDNLIVNPAGSEGTHFLMTSVAFEVETDGAEAALKEHDIQVRDLVVSRLENQTMQALTSPFARDSIKRQLAEAIRPVIGPKPRVQVYLPQFVIQ